MQYVVRQQYFIFETLSKKGYPFIWDKNGHKCYLLKDREEQVPKYKCTLVRIEIQITIIYAVRLNRFTNRLLNSGMQ